jgi:hypothetical protein
MNLKFKRGEKVCFHCTVQGVPHPTVWAEALEDGEMGVARLFRLQVIDRHGKLHQAAVPGKQIYAVITGHPLKT